MASRLKRIQVFLEESELAQVTRMAASENKSLSRVVGELVREALESIEDMVWDELAEKRKSKGRKPYTIDQMERKLDVKST